LREKILNARAELYTYSATHTTQELLQKAIDDICELTESSVGFYHFFEPEESNSSLQFWSTLTEKEFCKIQ
jgi:5-formyltetrahydrofolate cyclo-ligase